MEFEECVKTASFYSAGHNCKCVRTMKVHCWLSLMCTSGSTNNSSSALDVHYSLDWRQLIREPLQAGFYGQPTTVTIM